MDPLVWFPVKPRYFFSPIIPYQLWTMRELFPGIKPPKRESGQSLVSSGEVTNKMDLGLFFTFM